MNAQNQEKWKLQCVDLQWLSAFQFLTTTFGCNAKWISSLYLHWECVIQSLTIDRIWRQKGWSLSLSSKVAYIKLCTGGKIQWDGTGERRSLKFAPLGENCPFKILFAAVPRWWRIYHMNQGLVNNVYPIKSKTSPCSSLHLIAVVISKPYKI